MVMELAKSPVKGECKWPSQENLKGRKHEEDIGSVGGKCNRGWQCPLLNRPRSCTTLSTKQTPIAFPKLPKPL